MKHRSERDRSRRKPASGEPQVPFLRLWNALWFSVGAGFLVVADHANTDSSWPESIAVGLTLALLFGLGLLWEGRRHRRRKAATRQDE